MAEKLKAIFVTHEGFGSSIFQSQVIEHCESFAKLGYNFDILTFEPWKKNRRLSEGNLSTYKKRGTTKVILKRAMNIYFPFSTITNLFLLVCEILRLFRKQEYSFIHARADYTAFLCVLLKPLPKLPVIWDCRGDLVDELEFTVDKFTWFKKIILNVLLVPRQRFIRSIASRYSSSCITVSSALEKKLLSLNPDLLTHVIPCPVPGTKFYFSEERRHMARMDLGLCQDEQMFIYSGSMTGYQSLESFLWYYKKIINLPKSKILIATIDRAKAEHVFRGLDTEKIMIKTVNYDQMNDLYCAADFAIMVREPRPLNFVASPTKFGEYCLTGLTVIHNNSINQVSDYCDLLGNGLDLTIWPPVQKTVKSRKKVAIKSRELYGREYLNIVALECYRNL